MTIKDCPSSVITLSWPLR